MRRMVAACSMAAVLALQLSAGAVVAATPANDDLAAPEVITNLFGFQATPDMSEATMQDYEPACTDTEGQVMVHSVWYAWTSQQPAMIGIEIEGPEHDVTAAVFGPYETLPTSVAGLGDATSCIYGTGIYQGLTEYYAPAGASWLVQLTAVESFTTPTLNVDQLSPWNNDVAYPQPISYPVFEDSPPMDWTWLEDGEPVCSDVENQGLDASVWYRMDFDVPTDMGIEINGEPAHSVTAGVYGPFDPENMPTSPAGLEARGCIYDTGPEAAGHDRYAPGAYLVQLTRNSETGVHPSIRITEEMVTVTPWLLPASITVPEGVPIDFSWAWGACTADLAEQAQDAIVQTYTMTEDGVEVMGLSPEDAVGLWSGLEPFAVDPGVCRGKGTTSAALRWSWYVDNLTAGEYQLGVSIVVRRTITDGTVAEHGVVRLPAGTVIAEGTIDITVTEP